MSDYRLDVIYEDNHIIAVNKKASDIVQGDKTGDKPLSEFVKDYLKKKYNKPGNVFCGVIHRLDRPVSGLIIFARTSKALSRLNEMFRNRETQKTYWAIVKNQPPKTQDTLVHFLTKNQKQNKSYSVAESSKGALKSELTYKLISSADNYHLLQVQPKTGRHHQIRVQLSAIGCPIKGDLKYGFARSNQDASIHLHARSLTFIHPTKREEISLTAPCPKDALWNHFSENLSQ